MLVYLNGIYSALLNQWNFYIRRLGIEITDQLSSEEFMSTTIIPQLFYLVHKNLPEMYNSKRWLVSYKEQNIILFFKLSSYFPKAKNIILKPFLKRNIAYYNNIIPKRCKLKTILHIFFQIQLYVFGYPEISLNKKKMIYYIIKFI